MSNQYRLVELENSELLAGLSELVQQSNVLIGQLLAHLVELDERKLHLELGFSSLFAYCVEALAMSEGSAGRRVTAARVCRRFPKAFERVARGELHLCALCALAPHLNEANATELFEACRGKTRRQIEELLAARFPRPDVREQIRRLPAAGRVRVEAVSQPSPAPRVLDALDALGALDGLGDARSAEEPSSRAADPEVRVVAMNSALPSTPSRPRGREIEPLSRVRFGVHFTADAELRDLIERARALASHRIPNGDLAGLMKLVVASFVKQEEKRRFGIGTRPRRARSEAKSASRAEPVAPPGGASASPRTCEAPTRAARPRQLEKRTRHVSARVRREIHARDGGRCAFVSPDGRRCTARGLLEFDHVKPFAKFFAADSSNLRLLCRAHNVLHARNCFGAMHLAAKIAARNRSDSGPRAGSPRDCPISSAE